MGAPPSITSVFTCDANSTMLRVPELLVLLVPRPTTIARVPSGVNAIAAGWQLTLMICSGPFAIELASRTQICFFSTLATAR